MSDLSVIVVLLAVLCGVGCGYLFGEQGHLRDRSMDYKQAREVEKFWVPPELQSKSTRPLFPVPELSARSEVFSPKDFNDVPRPQVIEEIAAAGQIQLIRSNGEIWLLMQGTAQQANAWLRAYFKQKNIALSDSSQSVRWFDTVWVDAQLVQEKKGAIGRSLAQISQLGKKERMYERYRAVFVDNVVPGISSTKIQLMRQALVVESPDLLEQHTWFEPSEQKTPVLKDAVRDVKYPSKEFWLDIVAFMTQKLELMAQAQQSQVKNKEQPRVILTQDGNGLPILMLEQSFIQAWESVGYALKNLNIQVEDLNRSLAIYYIQWLNDDKNAQMQPYQVLLSKSENGIHISLQVDDSTVAPKQVSERLLSRLKSTLEEQS